MWKLSRPDRFSIMLTCAWVTLSGGCAGTALHIAAGDGDMTEVQRLIRKGKDVNAGDEDGDTPLHKAVRKSHTEIVALLIAEGATVNTKNNSHYTPVEIAAARGNKEITALLISKGADRNAAFLRAAKSYHEDLVVWLLSQGANLNDRNRYGRTPLHEAYGWEKMDMVDLLLSKGADTNSKDKHGRTPESVKGLALKSEKELIARILQRDRLSGKRDYNCEFEKVWSVLTSSGAIYIASTDERSGHMRTTVYTTSTYPPVEYVINIFVTRRTPERTTVRAEAEIKRAGLVIADFALDLMESRVKEVFRILDREFPPEPGWWD